MVRQGYLTPEQSAASFSAYWASYDYQRDNLSTATSSTRKDKAPFFFRIHPQPGRREPARTARHLQRRSDHPHHPRPQHAEGRRRHHGCGHRRDQQEVPCQQRRARNNVVDAEVSPLLDMVSPGFNLPDFRASSTQYLRDAKTYVTDTLSPTIDLTSKMFGLEEVQDAAVNAYQSVIDLTRARPEVEGALITHRELDRLHQGHGGRNAVRQGSISSTAPSKPTSSPARRSNRCSTRRPSTRRSTRRRP